MIVAAVFNIKSAHFNNTNATICFLFVQTLLQFEYHVSYVRHEEHEQEEHHSQVTRENRLSVL